MQDNSLNIIISAQDNASKVFKGLTSEVDKTTSKMQGSLSSIQNKLKGFATNFKANWLAITASITASIYAIRQAFDIIKAAAKFKQQEEAFENLAASVGASGEDLIRTLKKMSGETLSTSAVMQQASRALVLGLQADQLPRLMEISRSAARAFGEDVDFMFQSIVLGIGRQSRMILDNLGIIVKAEDAYEKYAATLGINAKQLTDLQKRTAFANAAMAAGADIIDRVNASGKTQIETLQSLAAMWDNLKISVGGFFLDLAQQAAVVADVLAVGLVTAIQRTAEGFAFLFSLIPGFDDMKEKLNEFIMANGDVAVSIGEDAMQMVDMIEKVSKNAMYNARNMRNLVKQQTEEVKASHKQQVDFFKQSVTDLGAALTAAEGLNASFAKAGAAVSIGMAIVNTAEGITKALATYPWPASLGVAAIIAATGALQIATISAQKFEAGGRPILGQPAIVGEKGPEVFVPDSLGTIIPNHRLGGGKQISIMIEINHPTIRADEDIDLLTQEISMRLANEAERL